MIAHVGYGLSLAELEFVGLGAHDLDQLMPLISTKNLRVKKTFCG